MVAGVRSAPFDWAIRFITGISGPQAQRVWQAYLVNFVFWFGMAAGAIVFVAILKHDSCPVGTSSKTLGRGPGSIPAGLFHSLLAPLWGTRQIIPMDP